MEDIKKLFNRMIIVTIIFLIYGLVIRNKYVLVGLVSGCIISILSLYMLSTDVKSIAYTKDQKIAKRIALIGFLKRYFLYIIYLAIILHFLDLKGCDKTFALFWRCKFQRQLYEAVSFGNDNRGAI